MKHWAIYINNQSNTQDLLNQLSGRNEHVPNGLQELAAKKGAVFSKVQIDRFIEEEERHDQKLLTANTAQRLQSFSSGERKKALFRYLLASGPEYLVLHNLFDNLDTDTQEEFKAKIKELSSQLHIVQLLSREGDLLPFINSWAVLNGSELQWLDKPGVPDDLHKDQPPILQGQIPGPLEKLRYEEEFLIRLKNINVHYGDKPVLRDIQWEIKPGEFWELAGRNGSGKTTILSMITGDNPKAYGQDLHLFGQRKGSGESIWEIKRNIGYFTPAMTDRFRGYHSLENMLISGLLDSIGLYVIPNEAQIRLARQWLSLIGLEDERERYFHEISLGQQRLIMCIRAMIKHPLLIILDEPTAGLDDSSAAMVVSLVNKMAKESEAAIIFVSHRKEPGLKPELIYRLEMGESGSTGKVL